jgi:hypothetical protein
MITFIVSQTNMLALQSSRWHYIEDCKVNDKAIVTAYSELIFVYYLLNKLLSANGDIGNKFYVKSLKFNTRSLPLSHY